VFSVGPVTSEQLEGKQTDARTDIFAFGAVVYEMATGRKAFAGNSQASVIAAILEREPPPMSSIQPMTPPALDRVVKICLAKDPEDRWQATRDLWRELKAISEGVAEPAAPALSGPLARSLRLWMAATAVLLLATVSLAVIHFREKPAPEAPTVQFSVFPPENVTVAPLIGNTLAVSPDGRRLAFIALTADGKQLLWIRPLDSRVAQPLAGTESALSPFWSPDGRFLGFFAGSKLKKIEASGGPPQTLCDLRGPGLGGTWNRDGIILFAQNPAGDLFRISSSGGAITPVTTPDMSRQEVGHVSPQFLPDGRRFLFYRRSLKPEHTGVYLGSLDSKETRLLVRGNTTAGYTAPHGGPAGYLFFAREATLIAQPFDLAKAQLTEEAFVVAEGLGFSIMGAAFSISENGVLAYRGEVTAKTQLAWFDREGKRIESIGAPGDFMSIALAPDEKTAAVTLRNPQAGTWDIWLLDLMRRGSTRFTFGPAPGSAHPVWSPDGSRIAFNSSQPGSFSLYVKDSSGAGKEEALLESLPGPAVATSWSSDGRFLAYEQWGARRLWDGDLGILPMFGYRKPFLFLQTEFSNIQGRFSPDGRWMAYVSNETGNYEVYVRSFSPGAAAGGQSPVTRKWQVSIGGGSHPRWRRDGKELFYIAPDSKLMAVEVRADASSFQAGVPMALFPTRVSLPPQAPGVYAVSADGRRFLFSTPIEEALSSPIQVVVNRKPVARR
jgi:Tol biopolymer transport system component